MKKYPKNRITVDVEALGGEVTLTELTQGYRYESNANPELDTPRLGLINAGLTEDQINLLGERVLIDLYDEVVELTYPNARAELQRLIDEGLYTPPTDNEKEESKKK